MRRKGEGYTLTTLDDDDPKQKNLKYECCLLTYIGGCEDAGGDFQVSALFKS